jgi:hypothetical protein
MGIQWWPLVWYQVGLWTVPTVLFLLWYQVGLRTGPTVLFLLWYQVGLGTVPTVLFLLWYQVGLGTVPTVLFLLWYQVGLGTVLTVLFRNNSDSVIFVFVLILHFVFLYPKFIRGPLWPCSYGSYIYNYLCNQCLSPLVWVRISIRARCTTLCDNIY